MRKGKLFVGTSGWQYKHWNGRFYPGDNKGKAFDYYRHHFSTVELNTTFYHLPEVTTVKKWASEAPMGFIYSVKASRFITHMKKLKDGRNSSKLFLSRIGMLKKKLGPILFQLPPNWNVNADRLKEFLDILPKKYSYVFEFRTHTWYTKEILDLLKENNIAFCIYELDGHQSPMEVTADFIYIRLHGPGNKYQGDYSTTELSKWARRIRKWLKKGKDVYIYFDNDQLGYAAFNALALKRMLT